MKAALIMGSKSDMKICEKSQIIFQEFEVECETKVMSAHRNPEKVREFAKSASENFSVIIAAAGKSAHLAGVIASYTVLPVIGLPIESSFMNGLDSLLSIVQMPRYVPVATVGVNSAENAALLAIEILALSNDKLKKMLIEYKRNMYD